MAKLKLLIIEDDPDQRDLICETLEGHFGVGTTIGAGTREEVLSQDLGSFDLILSDYNLPDVDGIKLMEEVHQRCETPVIMVTGENVGRTAAEAIRRGATDYVVKFGDYMFTIPLIVEKNLAVANIKRENIRLQHELQNAIREVSEKNSQLEASLKQIEQVAATDALTGLYNRRHFSKVLDQLFAEAARYEKDLSCVMIDLDGYKKFNDTYGHQMGDQILMLVGKVISANLRTMDVAARYGGDEFVLLLPQCTGEEAVAVADRIRNDFIEASARLMQRTGVTMSIGIASTRQMQPASGEQLIGMADASLYRAKESGRNRIEVMRKAS